MSDSTFEQPLPRAFAKDAAAGTLMNGDAVAWKDGVINILGTPGSPDAMGYGFFVGERGRFGHIGGNVGYQATMVMFADTGKGAVIMTNDDIGLQVGNTVLDQIGKLHGWNYAAPPPPS
jgi:hypothetical protein